MDYLAERDSKFPFFEKTGKIQGFHLTFKQINKDLCTPNKQYRFAKQKKIIKLQISIDNYVLRL